MITQGNEMPKNKSLLTFIKEMKKNKSLYIMFIPAMVLLFIFNYIPLSGLILAFKDVSFKKGIWGSDWTQPFYNNFTFLFNSDSAMRAFRNTIILNGLFIVTGLILEVGIALLLNNVKNKLFKKATQSITLLPFFVSWIVVGVFAYNLFSTNQGVVNGLITSLGFEKVEWYNTPGAWPFILTAANRWKLTGYGSIIYLATLSGIDTSYYEAAEIDGATQWQKTCYISIPMLIPSMVIMTLLHVGKIMNADFGMFYAIVGEASMVFSTADVIDTFVYRGLRQTGDIGMSSAAGFVQSVISFFLVIGSNLLARKFDRDSAIF